MLSYINKFAVFVFSYFVFFSCNGSPIYLQNQSYLDAVQALARQGYALSLELLPESYAYQQTMHSTTENVNLFKGEYHGMRYSVNTTPLSMVYFMRDICRCIFKPYGNMPRYRDVDRWRDHFINQLQLEIPKNFAPDNYYATFTADVRKEILHNYGFYDNPAFIEFIKTFPEYEQHILASNNARELIREQLLKIGNLKKDSVNKILDETLPQLAQSAADKQQERIASYQDQLFTDIIERRESQAQKQALQARYDLQDHIIIQSGSGAPAVLYKRNDAIAETLKYDKDTSLETINTPLDDKSAQLLEQVNVPREFFETCVGNNTQHQLHKEFGDLLKEVSLTKPESIRIALTEHIVVGQELNHLGYVNEGYAFADFCHAILDFTKGVGKGAWHSLCNLGNCILHPIETITSVGKGLAEVDTYIRHLNVYALQMNLKMFRDLYDTISLLSSGDRELMHKKLYEIERENELWRAMYKSMFDHLKQQVKSLTAEKVGEEAGKFVTDIYLFGRISKAASNFSKFTKTRLLKVLEKIAKSGPTAEKITLATAEGVEVASSAEKIAQEAQALQHAVQDGSTVTQHAGQLEKAAHVITKSFDVTRLEPSIGNIEKVAKHIHVLEKIPGAMDLLQKVEKCGLKSSQIGQLGTARGAMYELEKAIDLINKGEEVIQFSMKIGGREFDIITKSKILECKNIKWDFKTAEQILEKKGTFGSQKKLAESLGKTFEIHSKQPIPEIWKRWFIEKGITFVEG